VTGSRGTASAVLGVAALSGAGTMVVELAAVRLLAPWFGSSLVVWTNVIAVVLLALAIGYLLGGRLAGGPRPLSTLSWVLLGAGALVAWLPGLGALCSRAFLPERMALHEAIELVGWGSLAVSLLVFLPPATLLGMVSPLAVEALSRARGGTAGRAGGTVLCVSTLGSLLGVFGTSHWLLPTLGLSWTFRGAGAALFGAGILARLVAGRAGPRTGSAAAVLGALLLSSLSAGARRPALGAGRVELEARESAYQSLRVVEERGEGGRLRFLQVNEGFDSFQSVWQEQPGPLPEGYYYNDFLLPRGWDRRDGPWRVLVLGLGAGTALRVFQGFPELDAHFTGVELDPVVVELGRRWFDLDAAAEQPVLWGGLDGRVALRVAPGPFEQIVVDCYANQVEIPPHLCTLEFFAQAREHLAPAGWLCANLGGFGFDDPVVASVSATCAAAFEAPVLLLRVPSSRNFMLLARRDAPLPWSAQRQLEAPEAGAPIALGARALPGFAHLVQPGEAGTLLTDDRSAIEELQLRSLREARRRRAVESDS